MLGLSGFESIPLFKSHEGLRFEIFPRVCPGKIKEKSCLKTLLQQAVCVASVPTHAHARTCANHTCFRTRSKERSQVDGWSVLQPCRLQLGDAWFFCSAHPKPGDSSNRSSIWGVFVAVQRVGLEALESEVSGFGLQHRHFH